jgi:hypothetical protein
MHEDEGFGCPARASLYFRLPGEISIVRICRGGVENPPVTNCKFAKLRRSSPAPTRVSQRRGKRKKITRANASIDAKNNAG